MINDGTKMILCDECLEWYHAACVKVKGRFDLPGLKWYCPICEGTCIIQPPLNIYTQFLTGLVSCSDQ